MMTDPIADMLTRIRNANRISRPMVDMPSTKMKARIAQVLKDEGFIASYQIGQLQDEEIVEDADPALPKRVLRIWLKYGEEGEQVIRQIERVSKPGCRIYRRHDQLKPVLDGLGVAILSTSRGVVSDRQARAQRIGGELICTVW
jgi:small subunit ribosomal protein S8